MTWPWSRRALLPAGLHELLAELGIRTLAVDEAEFETLGCNVLAVRPGVVVLAAGNPRIASRARRQLAARFTSSTASEIGLNGSGWPDLPYPPYPARAPM